jgi:hypothetical protein
MCLIAPMKQVSLRKSDAHTPRLTLWVPVILVSVLSLIWLGLVALLGH